MTTEEKIQFISDCLTRWEDWMHNEDAVDVGQCRIYLDEIESNYKELLKLNEDVGNWHEEEVEKNEKLESELKAVKAERDELKTKIEKSQKIKQQMLDALTDVQAENERLRHFISRFAYFIGLRNEDIKDFQHKAQELLKEKP